MRIISGIKDLFQAIGQARKTRRKERFQMRVLKALLDERCWWENEIRIYTGGSYEDVREALDILSDEHEWYGFPPVKRGMIYKPSPDQPISPSQWKWYEDELNMKWELTEFGKQRALGKI